MIELSYVITGLIAGLMAGLLGVGGGLITVPSLLLIFHYSGDSPEQAMPKAIATSLSAMIFTASSSAIAHYFKHAFSLNTFKIVAPGLFLGSIGGALATSYFPSTWLKFFFSFSIICIGLYFIFLQKDSFSSSLQVKSISDSLLRLYSFLIGFVSTLLGIGGGIVTTPLLIFYGLPIRQAVSTSALLGLLVASTGTLTFIITTWSHIESFTLIDSQACLMIGLSSCLVAPYGAKLSSVIDPLTLKRLFGCFLICAGLLMNVR